MFRFDMGNVIENYSWWTVGSEPTTPKAHGLPMTPIVKALEGYSPFDHGYKDILTPTQTKPYDRCTKTGAKPTENKSPG